MEVLNGKGAQRLQLTLERLLKICIYTYVSWERRGGEAKCTHLINLGKWYTGAPCTIFANFLYILNYIKIVTKTKIMLRKIPN